MGAKRGLTLTELLAVAAGLSCLGAVGLSALLDAQDHAERAICAMNLCRLGEAMRLYARAGDGYLPDCGAASPFGGPVPNDGFHYPSRFDAPGTCNWPHVRSVGNQANLWLLVREGYASPETLVCPATADRPSLNDPARPGVMGFVALDPATARRTPEEDEFFLRVAAGRCSYSYQNQLAHPGTDPSVAPPEVATTHVEASPSDLVILADRNPYTRPELTRQPTLSPDDHPEANSLNHHGRGQNVLYLEGHVEWCETPRAGPRRADGRRDSIYRPDEGRPDDPLNVPRSTKDVFLVP